MKKREIVAQFLLHSMEYQRMIILTKPDFPKDNFVQPTTKLKEQNTYDKCVLKQIRLFSMDLTVVSGYNLL